MDFANAFLDYIARTNLFNFIIFASIIIFLVKKLNVNAKMEDARKAVNGTIVDSKEVLAKSEEKLSGIEESMKHLEDDIDAILSESDERAKAIGNKILEDANKAVLAVKENTAKSLENSRMILKNDLIRRASLASVEVAKARIVSELAKNADLHDRLIAESIDAIEGVDL